MKWSVLIFLTCTLFCFSCAKRVGPTEVEVEDSVRHYYPIVLGDELVLSYKLTNKGAEAFVINDIQPSCGCIVQGDDHERIILPGKSLIIHFRFYSGKNLGYVRHTIRVFGNVKPKGYLPLVFDVNVVGPADYTPDYEEIYTQRMQDERKAGLKELVDGRASEKGYYVEDPEHDSREQQQFFWRKEE